MERVPVLALDLALALRAFRFRFSSERDLHRGVARALARKAIPFEDEVDLGGDLGIIDFLVDDRIGLELKIKGSPVEVTRQLLDYAESPRIEELVLCTGRARLGDMPPTLGGKPFHVVSLWHGGL